MSDKSPEERATTQGAVAADHQEDQAEAEPAPPNAKLQQLVGTNNNLPRKLRARVAGQVLDNVPKGKQIDAEPGRHFAIERQEHGTTAEKMNLANIKDKQMEMDKMHNTAKNADMLNAALQANNRTTPQGQRVYQKTMQSKGNQLMDSRHRTGGPVGKTRAGDGSRKPMNQ